MDSSKERRNLLVFSTAIILFWWLELPEGVISERILGAKLESALQAWKVWLAVLIVLIYQLHRFCAVNARNAVWTEFVNVRLSFLNESVVRLIKYNIINKKFGKTFIYEAIPNHLEGRDPYDRGPLQAINFFGKHVNGVIWEGTFTLGYGDVEVQEIKFSVPSPYRVGFIFFAQQLFFKKVYFTEFTIPFLLAIAAILFSVWQIIVSLFFGSP